MKLLLCALYLAALGVAAHFIGNALPRTWFHCDRFPWRSFPWERDGRIYRKIGVHRWKDHVPDMSKLCRDMVPKAVGARPTAKQLQTQLEENMVAEAVHWALVLLSLGVVWIWPGIGGGVVYFLSLWGNLPFVLIQRYNRPRLARLLERQFSKQEASR